MQAIMREGKNVESYIGNAVDVALGNVMKNATVSKYYDSKGTMYKNVSVYVVETMSDSNGLVTIYPTASGKEDGQALFSKVIFVSLISITDTTDTNAIGIGAVKTFSTSKIEFNVVAGTTIAVLLLGGSKTLVTAPNRKVIVRIEGIQ